MWRNNEERDENCDSTSCHSRQHARICRIACMCLKSSPNALKSSPSRTTPNSTVYLRAARREVNAIEVNVTRAAVATFRGWRCQCRSLHRCMQRQHVVPDPISLVLTSKSLSDARSPAGCHQSTSGARIARYGSRNCASQTADLKISRTVWHHRTFSSAPSEARPMLCTKSQKAGSTSMGT